jgi:hypothetical protein
VFPHGVELFYDLLPFCLAALCAFMGWYELPKAIKRFPDDAQSLKKKKADMAALGNAPLYRRRHLKNSALAIINASGLLHLSPPSRRADTRPSPTKKAAAAAPECSPGRSPGISSLPQPPSTLHPFVASGPPKGNRCPKAAVPLGGPRSDEPSQCARIPPHPLQTPGSIFQPPLAFPIQKGPRASQSAPAAE